MSKGKSRFSEKRSKGNSRGINKKNEQKEDDSSRVRNLERLAAEKENHGNENHSKSEEYKNSEVQYSQKETSKQYCKIQSKEDYNSKSNTKSKFSKYMKNIAAASLFALSSVSGQGTLDDKINQVQNQKYESAHSEAHSGAYKEQKTIHGAVGIIYHKTDDGNVLFLLEENPSDYAIVEYRGKTRTIGGSVNANDPSFKAAFVREVREELASKEGQDAIVSSFLGNPKVYLIKSYDVGGQEAKSVYFEVELDKKGWEAASSSRSSHDAGPFRIYTLNEIITIPSEKFAFGEGHILKSFANGILHGDIGCGHHRTLEQKTNSVFNEYY